MHAPTRPCLCLGACTPQGTAGAPLRSRALGAALQAHDLFVYMGHGSGEQYVPLAALRTLRCRAASLLIGCSSGRLRLMGPYGATGAVLSHVLAGW